jgi:hypothetical protein
MNFDKKKFMDAAVVGAMIKARELGVKMLASDCEKIIEAMLNAQYLSAQIAQAICSANQMSDALDEARKVDPAVLSQPIGIPHQTFNNEPQIDENIISVDKRDLFDFIRGSIRCAMATDDCTMSNGELWSVATDRTITVMRNILGPNAVFSSNRDDAERYRWLTEDHADVKTRRIRNSIIESMSVRSYSATSTLIDHAMKAGT